MTVTLATATTPTFLSEIFCLDIIQPNLRGFRLTPEIDKELGNRLSYYFSCQFPDCVVTWYDKSFWILGKPGKAIPNHAQWKEALNKIQQQVEDFKSYYWSFQWLNQPTPTLQVLAQLAYAILKTHRPFPSTKVTEEQGVEVKRIVEFWAETIQIKGELKPALALTLGSQILYKGNLANFYQNHPFRNNPENVLIGLKVQDIERGSSATIVQLGGTVGEHREKLIRDATGSISKLALEEAPEKQPLVLIRFGKNKNLYTYAMAALRLIITPQTADRFGVDWGKLIKLTKIPYQERKVLLVQNKIIAKTLLSTYGFQVADKAINSREHSALFWMPHIPLEQTLLLFGKGFKGVQGEILKGLDIKKGGGVYRRHKDYQFSAEIKITILRLCEMKVGQFVDDVQKCLKNYGFASIVVNAVPLSVQNSNNADGRAEVEKQVNELLATPTDIFLVFLPESDRHADYTEEGSFYSQIYSLLLNRRMASQFIYDDTLKKVAYKHILNQIIPGILAKLGNLPFILAEPLQIADCFIGLDISRMSKANLPGTLNACASIRIYGKQGEFIRYRLEGDLIEGEEIPQRFLEKILPTDLLKGKTVLIYRDGRFVNKEVENILARAKAINAKFILVECRKSQIPRLYNLESSELKSPTQGLALRLSLNEAILITTKITSENIGLARPLRLNIRSEGHPAMIESVVDTTLKLTLLHHGALKTPRLPMPLYGSDRMAELRLKGIYPSVLEDDRQFWL